MPPMAIIIGFRLLAWNMKTIIPSDATIMTTGSAFMTMLPGMTRGTSGGGSRCTSPPGGGGAASRGDFLNCSVLIEGPLFKLDDGGHRLVRKVRGTTYRTPRGNSGGRRN